MMATSLSSCRCVVPFSSCGVQIAMATLMGFLSIDSHSMSPANFTSRTAVCLMASLFACGMAKPSIIPVVPSDSRALKASSTAFSSSA